MPTRGAYEVASTEEGKPPKVDRSRRHCAVWLIIFFLTCIVLILACWPWKRSAYNDPNRYERYTNKDPTEPPGIDSTKTATEQSLNIGNTTNIKGAVKLQNLTTPKSTDGTTSATTVYSVNSKVTFDDSTKKDFAQTSTSPTTTQQVVLETENSTLETDKEIPKETVAETTPHTDTNYSTTASNSAIEDDKEIHAETVATTTEISSTVVNYSTMAANSTVENAKGIPEETVTETTPPANTNYSTAASNSTTENDKEIPEETVATTTEIFSTVNYSTTAANSTVESAKGTREVAFTETTSPSNINYSTTAAKSTTEDDKEMPEETVATTPDISSTVNYSTTAANSTVESAKGNSEVAVTETTSPTDINYSTTAAKSTVEDDKEIPEDTVATTTDISSSVNYSTTGANSTVENGKGTPEVTIAETTSPTNINYSTTETNSTIEDDKKMPEETVATTTEISSTVANYSTTIENYIWKRTEETTKSSLNATETTESLPRVTTLISALLRVYNGSNITDESLTATSNQELMLGTVPGPDEHCTTETCKHKASRLLSYMNHSVDPCEDFYEYACGGFESDYQIRDKDLSLRVYETIERQANKNRHLPKAQQSKIGSRFNEYYDSCLMYDTNVGIRNKIDLANEALGKIGKWQSRESQESQDFTQLFANMLLQDRPLFFDIVPEVNDNKPSSFILKIGPAVDKKLFQFANGPDRCDNQNEEESDVNLDELYINYTKCKNDVGTFEASINQTLKKLGVNGSEVDIDFDIIRKIHWSYTEERKIHEAYISKNYTLMTLGQLQNHSQLLNWTELIQSLTNLTYEPEDELQVYYKDELIAAMQNLQKLINTKRPELNNALLGLYARNLYKDLVATRFPRYLHKHCMYIAVHFMKREASGLYMSSFTDTEIEHRRRVMGDLFRELKETMKLGINNTTDWSSEIGRKEMIQKLRSIKIIMPDSSMVNLQDANELDITDDYFENSMTLMKKYRSMMYSVITQKLKPSEQIWTFFASPFEVTAQTIYGLNRVVIPFGAVDSPSVWEIEESTRYLTYATIGNLIAREIAHFFDTIGIRYWNGSRTGEFAPLINDESDETKENFNAEYVECHNKSLASPTSVTAQRVKIHFTIPPLTLNERLSDAVGLRLASDTFARLRSNSTKELPWLNLNVTRLFYLAYVQDHCTKAPLASSYVTLNEDPTLPSRIRFSVLQSNSIEIKPINLAWKCSKGANTNSESKCSTFPYVGILPDDEDDYH